MLVKLNERVRAPPLGIKPYNVSTSMSQPKAKITDGHKLRYHRQFKSSVYLCKPIFLMDICLNHQQLTVKHLNIFLPLRYTETFTLLNTVIIKSINFVYTSINHNLTDLVRSIVCINYCGSNQPSRIKRNGGAYCKLLRSSSIAR